MRIQYLQLLQGQIKELVIYSKYVGCSEIKYPIYFHGK